MNCSSFVTLFLLRLLLLLSECKFDSICFVCHTVLYVLVCVYFCVYMHEFSYILLLTLLSQGILLAARRIRSQPFVRSRVIRPYIVFDSTISMWFCADSATATVSVVVVGLRFVCVCVFGMSAQNIFKSHWNRSKCAINWSHSHTLARVHRTAHV